MQTVEGSVWGTRVPCLWTRQAIRTSEDNLSLKTMEIFFAEAREGDVTKADQSVVEYKSWQASREQKILDMANITAKSSKKKAATPAKSPAQVLWHLTGSGPGSASAGGSGLAKGRLPLSHKCPRKARS